MDAFSLPDAVLQVIVTLVTIFGALFVARAQSHWQEISNSKSNAARMEQFRAQILIDLDETRTLAFGLSLQVSDVISSLHDAAEFDSALLIIKARSMRMRLPAFLGDAPAYAEHLPVHILRMASDVRRLRDEINDRATILEQMSDTRYGASSAALVPYLDDIRDSARRLEERCRLAIVELRGPHENATRSELGTTGH